MLEQSYLPKRRCSVCGFAKCYSGGESIKSNTAASDYPHCLPPPPYNNAIARKLDYARTKPSIARDSRELPHSDTRATAPVSESRAPATRAANDTTAGATELQPSAFASCLRESARDRSRTGGSTDGRTDDTESSEEGGHAVACGSGPRRLSKAGSVADGDGLTPGRTATTTATGAAAGAVAGAGGGVPASSDSAAWELVDVALLALEDLGDKGGKVLSQHGDDLVRLVFVTSYTYRTSAC